MEGLNPLEKFYPKQRTKEELTKWRYRNSVDVELDPLPYLRNVPQEEKQNVFIAKVRQCTNIVRGAARNTKCSILLELKEFVQTQHAVLTPAVVCPEIVRMFSAHLSWAELPGESPLLHVDYYDEEAQSLHKYFPEICTLYELTIVCMKILFSNPSGLENVIDRNLVLKILREFQTESLYERACLKMILYHIYRNFRRLRSFIRKQVSNILLAFSFEREDFAGIREILLFCEGIQFELELPLENEHELFFERVLLPLYRTKCFPIFQEELCKCFLGYIHKDISLGSLLLDGMIVYWPKSDSKKEVIMLKQMRELALTMGESEFPTILEPYFEHLNKVALTGHFKVARELLRLLSDDFIFEIIEQFNEVVIPIIVPGLKRMSEDHWKNTIVCCARRILQCLQEVNSDLFHLVNEQN